MRGIAVESVCSGDRSKSDLYIAIRFFLLIRRRELSNSISLQKCFHQIKIPFRLNNEAHMTARNCADLRSDTRPQIGSKPCHGGHPCIDSQSNRNGEYPAQKLDIFDFSVFFIDVRVQCFYHKVIEKAPDPYPAQR